MTKYRFIALVFTIGLPIAILGVGISSFGLLKMLRPQVESPDSPIVGQPVFVAPVEQGSVRLSADEQGEVGPVRETQLSAAVAGRVIYVSTSLLDGGTVTEGEVLVRMEPSEYRLAFVQAQAAVASARQVLATVKAEAEIAKRDWEALGRGEPSDLVLRRPQLEEAEASLEAAIARSEDAALQLSRTEVEAPFAGRVRSRSVELGQFVSPGQVLAGIYATDAVEVAVQLSLSQMLDIGLSPAYNRDEAETSPVIEAVLSAEIGGKRWSWPGLIVRTGAAIDPSTRLISVYVRVDDPFGAAASDAGLPLSPGLFVDVGLRGREVDDVLIVPRLALRGNDRVYVVEETDEQAVMRIVTVDVLTSDPEHAYISDGLEVGMLAVTSPVQAAFDGMRIKPITERGTESAQLGSRTGVQ